MMKGGSQSLPTSGLTRPRELEEDLPTDEQEDLFVNRNNRAGIFIPTPTTSRSTLAGGRAAGNLVVNRGTGGSTIMGSSTTETGRGTGPGASRATTSGGGGLGSSNYNNAKNTWRPPVGTMRHKIWATLEIKTREEESEQYFLLWKEVVVSTSHQHFCHCDSFSL